MSASFTLSKGHLMVVDLGLRLDRALGTLNHKPQTLNPKCGLHCVGLGALGRGFGIYAFWVCQSRALPSAWTFASDPDLGSRDWGLREVGGGGGGSLNPKP